MMDFPEFHTHTHKYAHAHIDAHTVSNKLLTCIIGTSTYSKNTTQLHTWLTHIQTLTYVIPGVWQHQSEHSQHDRDEQVNWAEHNPLPNDITPVMVDQILHQLVVQDIQWLALHLRKYKTTQWSTLLLARVSHH